MKAALLGFALTLCLASAASASFTLSHEPRISVRPAGPAAGMLEQAEADASHTSGAQNSGGFDGAATGFNRYALDVSGLRAVRIDITGRISARQDRAKGGDDVTEQVLVVPEPASLAVWCLVGMTSLAAGVSRRRKGVC